MNRYLTRSEPARFLFVFAALLLVWPLLVLAEVSGVVPGSSSKSHWQQQSSHRLKTTSQPRHSGMNIWFDQIEVELLADDDGNGYHSRFSVSFDIDTLATSWPVYALLSLETQGTYQSYYETSVLTVSGTTGSDLTLITTTLSDPYVTSHYNLIIQLFDADTHELILQADSLSHPQLNALYLESIQSDRHASSSAYLDDIRFRLFEDDDGDGFHSEFEWSIDVDHPEGQSQVELILYIKKSSDEEWVTLLHTDAFAVAGFSQLDRQTAVLSLESGYRADLYDYRIRLTDAATGLVLDTWESQRHQRLPLESRDWDDDYHDYHQDPGSPSVHVEAYAGSLTAELVGLLLLGCICSPLALLSGRWFSGKRREPIRGGSMAAAMPPTFPPKYLPESKARCMSSYARFSTHCTSARWRSSCI